MTVQSISSHILYAFGVNRLAERHAVGSVPYPHRLEHADEAFRMHWPVGPTIKTVPDPRRVGEPFIHAQDV